MKILGVILAIIIGLAAGVTIGFGAFKTSKEFSGKTSKNLRSALLLGGALTELTAFYGIIIAITALSTI